MRVLLTFCLLTSIVFSGCALLQPETEETAEDLIDKGMKQYNKGSYRTAIQTFEKLRDWYPFSKYAILAELKIADAFYQLRYYNDAIYAYREFESLHPRNEATPYVINQIGLSYFGSVGTIDRDQGAAARALQAFQRLIRQFPDSEYAAEARENIRKCQRSLAGNELEIGLFYFKQKRYEAALHRFRTLLAMYPDVGEIHQQALQFIALCERSLEDQQSESEEN